MTYELPKDIRDIALQVFCDLGGMGDIEAHEQVGVIAKALHGVRMAERSRCANVADEVRAENDAALNTPASNAQFVTAALTAARIANGIRKG